MRQSINVDVVEISTRQFTKIPRTTKIAILMSGSISLNLFESMLCLALSVRNRFMRRCFGSIGMSE